MRSQLEFSVDLAHAALVCVRIGGGGPTRTAQPTRRLVRLAGG
jgi:hypothetical protein